MLTILLERRKPLRSMYLSALLNESRNKWMCFRGFSVREGSEHRQQSPRSSLRAPSPEDHELGFSASQQIQCLDCCKSLLRVATGKAETHTCRAGITPKLYRGSSTPRQENTDRNPLTLQSFSSPCFNSWQQGTVAIPSGMQPYNSLILSFCGGQGA